MKAYRRILVTNFSSCPSVAQLSRCGELAARDDCKARIVLLMDRGNIFESDGPAGIFPQEDLIEDKLADARQRLGLLRDRSGLGWAQASVVLGEPKRLLARELKTWHPDLVIVTHGWGHVRRVERAAREAGIPVPDIIGVAPDRLYRKLLNALLPISAAALRFPLGNIDDALHGHHHHAAG